MRAGLASVRAEPLASLTVDPSVKHSVELWVDMMVLIKLEETYDICLHSSGHAKGSRRINVPNGKGNNLG